MTSKQPTLTLIRGVPGSGKSTLARALAKSQMSIRSAICEADDYFIDNQGKYAFDASKIKEAHIECQHRTYSMLSAGFNVYVSNTFIKRWEMIAYFQMAKEFKLVPAVYHCQNRFDNQHGVPLEAVERMRMAFENDCSELFSFLNH